MYFASEREERTRERACKRSIILFLEQNEDTSCILSTCWAFFLEREGETFLCLTDITYVTTRIANDSCDSYLKLKWKYL